MTAVKTTCARCGAVEPGRFCAECGADCLNGDGAATTLDGDLGVEETVGPTILGISPARVSPATPHVVTSASAAPPQQNPWPAGYPALHSEQPGLYGVPVYAPPVAATSKSHTPAIIGLSAVLLALVGGIWWMATDHDGSEKPAVAAAPAATVTVTSSSTPTPTTPAAPPRQVAPPPVRTFAPAPSPPAPAPSQYASDAKNEQAQAELESIRQSHMGSINHDGRWVAQLASKRNGITDPKQETSSGNHTHYYADILEEHRRLAARFDSVYLVKPSQIGSSAPESTWITYHDGSFGSKSEAQTWCADKYRGLSGDELQNRCAVRQIR